MTPNLRKLFAIGAIGLAGSAIGLVALLCNSSRDPQKQETDEFQFPQEGYVLYPSEREYLEEISYPIPPETIKKRKVPKLQGIYDFIRVIEGQASDPNRYFGEAESTAMDFLKTNQEFLKWIQENNPEKMRPLNFKGDIKTWSGGELVFDLGEIDYRIKLQNDNVQTTIETPSITYKVIWDSRGQTESEDNINTYQTSMLNKTRMEKIKSGELPKESWTGLSYSLQNISPGIPDSIPIYPRENYQQRGGLEGSLTSTRPSEMLSIPAYNFSGVDFSIIVREASSTNRLLKKLFPQIVPKKDE
ncbi:MAG: hypothetical protein Q8P57_00585 [Candidatus Pacearchaeota archaeon]|nr:hypothetical protein [Candidatus Pacearchaeota archaeon]